MATTKKTKTSKKAKLMRYLESGKTITAKQARAFFSVKNLRATVSDIRLEEGRTIIPTRTKNVTKYKLVKN